MEHERTKVHVVAGKSKRRPHRNEDTDDNDNEVDGPDRSLSPPRIVASPAMSMTQPARPAIGGGGTSHKLTDEDEGGQSGRNERLGRSNRKQSDGTMRRTRLRSDGDRKSTV